MQIHDAPTPAAIIDRAVVERNCERMQEACQALDVEFRAHTKTHKVNSEILAFVCFHKEFAIQMRRFLALPILS